MLIETAEPGTQRYDVRRALIIGAFLSIVIAGYAMTFDSEDSLFLLKLKPGSGMHPMPDLFAVAASIALGMGLGSLTALFVSNRTRLRAVLSPNRGRVICAIVLALLIPVAQFWGIPFALGFFTIGAISNLGEGLSERPLEVLAGVGILMVGGLFSYVVSSLIISGTQSRLVRIALFGQVWLALYAVTLLVFGFYRGNM